MAASSVWDVQKQVPPKPSSSRADELGSSGLDRPRQLLTRAKVPVVAVALDREASGFTNRVLQRGNSLLLRRRCACHVEDFFLDDRAVQIIDTRAERDLPER